jgi:hypothetical protein
MAALLASALAGVLVAASLGGQHLLAAAVVLVQALLVVGMARFSDVPAARTSGAVALVAGAVASVLVAQQPDGPLDPQTLAPVLIASGGGFVALVIVQLARSDGRARLTASLSLGVTMLVLASATAIWLGLGTDEVGEAVLLVALAGTAVGAAIAVFPGPVLLWAVGGVIAAASVGLIMDAYAPPVADSTLSAGAAALVAGLCGLAAVAGLWVARLVRDDRSVEDAPMPGPGYALLSATLPVVLAAPVAFCAAWAVADGLVG